MNEGSDRRRRLAAAFAAGVVVVCGAVLVQHLRHGWPFSLHHGVAAETAPAAEDHSAHAAPMDPTPRVSVTIEPSRLVDLGIRLEPATTTELEAELRAVATVVPDEARVSHVHTRVSGWIEQLSVRTTGEQVRAGQRVASIFSQELLASQTEYLAVLRAAPRGSSGALAAGARERLGVFGMTPREIAALERRGTPSRTVAVISPRAGVVLSRGVTVGTAVDPSTELFLIADLTRVWLLAEIPEDRAAEIQVGASATIEVPASGQPPLEAEVSFVYPTLTERLRTLRVRFEIDNPTGAFRPGMYGNARFHLDSRQTLTVPRDAVVDTGVRQHVFVRGEESSLEPRTVEMGRRLGDRVEILSGLHDGEEVVASGVFLIDSESRLRAGGGTAHQHGGSGESETSSDPGDSAEHPGSEAGHGGHGD